MDAGSPRLECFSPLHKLKRRAKGQFKSSLLFPHSDAYEPCGFLPLPCALAQFSLRVRFSVPPALQLIFCECVR